jgi:hypothetical protein
MSESDDSQVLIAFDATTTRIVGELYEDTQYIKLSTFSCTFRNAMTTYTIKTNMILKDAKPLLDEARCRVLGSTHATSQINSS